MFYICPMKSKLWSIGLKKVYKIRLIVIVLNIYKTIENVKNIADNSLQKAFKA